ncbi:MAG: hypothetical protein WB709_12615 [Solirubrobacteraceae bacterium]
MEFALVLRELARQRRLLMVGVLVAGLAAVLSVYRLDGLKLKPRSLQYSSASTKVFVDTSSSVLGNLSQSFEPLQSRATVYANFMASPTVLNLIGQRSGIPGDQIYAAGPIDPLVPRIVQEPTAVQRNVQITGETTPYRLNFNSDPNLPTIGIFAQAPTTAQSVRLANAAVAGLQQYVVSLEEADHVPQSSRVVIRQLGEAKGGVVDGGISKAVAMLVFVAVFVMWCVLMLLFARFRDTWRVSASLAEAEDTAEQAEPETEITIDVPSRRRSSRETVGVQSEKSQRNGKKAQSGEYAPDMAAAAERHARLHASGS